MRERTATTAAMRRHRVPRLSRGSRFASARAEPGPTPGRLSAGNALSQPRLIAGAGAGWRRTTGPSRMPGRAAHQAAAREVAPSRVLRGPCRRAGHGRRRGRRGGSRSDARVNRPNEFAGRSRAAPRNEKGPAQGRALGDVCTGSEAGIVIPAPASRIRSRAGYGYGPGRRRPRSWCGRGHRR